MKVIALLFTLIVSTLALPQWSMTNPMANAQLAQTIQFQNARNYAHQVRDMQWQNQMQAIQNARAGII